MGFVSLAALSFVLRNQLFGVSGIQWLVLLMMLGTSDKT